MLNESDLKPFIKVLEQYEKEFSDVYKGKLEERRASGKLIDSIKVHHDVNGTEYIVSVDLENWWYWLEHDRKPTQKGKHCPIEPIIEWIEAKGIKPEERNGKLPTEAELPYLIRAKIDREGYKGGKYMQKTVDAVNAKYIPLLQEALEQCVMEYAITLYNILPTPL